VSGMKSPPPGAADLHAYADGHLDAAAAAGVESALAQDPTLVSQVQAIRRQNALLREALDIMAAWGFKYKTNIVWYKIRKDGGPDGRGVGFYFRNVTELILFGVRGSMRTLPAGRRQVNMIETRKREHSRKPDEQYDLIEACSPGPYLELFARYPREGWGVWGDESEEGVMPRGRQYPAYS